VGIKFTGLRPGEKLREELFGATEQRADTDHEMVFKISAVDQSTANGQDFFDLIHDMTTQAKSQEAQKSLALLHQAVPNYEAADLPDEIREGTYKDPL
jgi:FlaA1/EpsC-like NDP-sugar epimerase